jgi:hypothetical protein
MKDLHVRSGLVSFTQVATRLRNVLLFWRVFAGILSNSKEAVGFVLTRIKQNKGAEVR